MSDSLNILLSGLEKRPDFPDQPARSKVRNAWVYFWVGNNETTLRADENGNVLRHVSGPIDEKESYQEPFVTEEGTKAEVAFSLGDKPLRRADIEPQLRLFTLKNDLSDPGGPIFVPKSGTKKVRVLPKTHIRAGFPSEPLKGDEISLIADFPETWGASRAAEIKAVEDKIWHPGTRQFREVANTPNRDAKQTTLRPVSNVSNLLDEILARPMDSIRRLNIFTHANPGIISLSGSFEAEAVLLNPTDSVGGQPIAGAFDGSVIVWLNEDSIGRAQRDDMRRRFTKHGEILLFLCNGGLGTGLSLVQDIAQCLHVRVLAYSDPIGYYIDFADGKLNRNLTSQGLVSDSGFASAKASGKIASGYPCVVAVPKGVSDGGHVRPDKNTDKPKNPKP